MNRDIPNYEKQYLKQPYEKYQVAFRKCKLKEILSKYEHATLLEVGCGMESIFNQIDTYRQLVVLEPAKIFFEKALDDKEAKKDKDIVLLNGFLEDEHTQLMNYNFDFIIVSCLLHEIPNKNKFLEALHNLSNSNTVIHFNVPNAKSFHRLLAVEMGLINNVFELSESNVLFQQSIVFDIDLLKSTMEENDFMVIESGAYSFKPFPHDQMQNMIDNGTITEQALDGFYKMEKYLPNMGSEVFVNVKKNR